MVSSGLGVVPPLKVQRFGFQILGGVASSVAVPSASCASETIVTCTAHFGTLFCPGETSSGQNGKVFGTVSGVFGTVSSVAVGTDFGWKPKVLNLNSSSPLSTFLSALRPLSMASPALRPLSMALPSAVKSTTYQMFSKLVQLSVHLMIASPLTMW